MATTTKMKSATVPISQAKSTALKKLAALDRKLELIDRDRPISLLAKVPDADLAAVEGNLPAGSGPEERLAPKEPKVKHLVLRAEVGESVDKVRAVAALSPIYSNALTANRFIRYSSGGAEIGPNESVECFNSAAARVNIGDMTDVETILMSQSITLNAIFCDMAAKASVKLNDSIAGAELLMRMALKAQAQCRSTLEALAEVKNPRQTSFIRQQNVAQQQQVNNGAPIAHAPAHGHEKNPNMKNELLEVQHGERLESGTAGAASGNDPHLATVDAINRPAHGKRQRGQQSKRT